MNTRHCLLECVAVFFLLSSYGHCLAEDKAITLAVQEIVLETPKSGDETVAVLCSQTCIPVLSGLEGKKPRIVMDFTGVSDIDAKYRHVPVSGKYVKKLRSYLDPASKKLRVVLDLDPSTHYVIYPTQDRTANAYFLVISEKWGEKSKYAKKNQKTKTARISIIDQGYKPVEKGLEPVETATGNAPVGIAGVMKDEISVEQGRSQMNVGHYTAAVNIFTEMIANHPQNSLYYRLRGDAYKNMGDRQKAVGDWITAARLGDKIIRSYLDYMQINWKEAPNPSKSAH